MITEKSNRLQVIVITDYDYPISGSRVYSRQGDWGIPPNFLKIPPYFKKEEGYSYIDKEEKICKFK